MAHGVASASRPNVRVIDWPSFGGAGSGGRRPRKGFRPPQRHEARSFVAMMATADLWQIRRAVPSLSATSEQREMDDGFIDPQGRAMAEPEAQSVVTAETGGRMHGLPRHHGCIDETSRRFGIQRPGCRTFLSDQEIHRMAIIHPGVGQRLGQARKSLIDFLDLTGFLAARFLILPDLITLHRRFHGHHLAPHRRLATGQALRPKPTCRARPRSSTYCATAAPYRSRAVPGIDPVVVRIRSIQPGHGDPGKSIWNNGRVLALERA